MKIFIGCFVGACAAILFCGFPGFSTENPPAAIPNQNEFSFIYEASIRDLPPGAREFQVWAPLAKNDDHQTILQRKIEAPGPYKILTDPEYGNEILYLSLENVSKEALSFKISYEVATRGRERELHSAASREASWHPDGMELHLASNQLMIVNEEIRRIAEEITAGKVNDLEKAQAIYEYVIGHMRYDKSGTGWGRGDTLFACETGRGNCTDFHSLFISLARASGIPARFKIGAQIPWDPSEGTVGYHCWAEFFLKGEGWIPVDASEAWKQSQFKEYYFGSVDPGKFTISMGRDLALKPRQKGGPVNIFIYPYVEVDGKPFGSVETKFSYKRRIS